MYNKQAIEDFMKNASANWIAFYIEYPVEMPCGGPVDELPHGFFSLN